MKRFESGMKSYEHDTNRYDMNMLRTAMTIRFDVLHIPVFLRCGAAVSRVEEVKQQNIARASIHGKSGKPTPRIESNTSCSIKRLPPTSMFENLFVPWGKVTGCQHVGCDTS